MNLLVVAGVAVVALVVIGVVSFRPISTYPTSTQSQLNNPPAPALPTNLNPTRIAESIQNMINQKRTDNGFSRLHWNSLLAEISKAGSEENSHTHAVISNEETELPTHRAEEYGYFCNEVHQDALNHPINEVNMKVDPRDGYDTNEIVAIYSASYLFENGANMKGNLEGGIGITIDNDGILWITFDGC